MKLADLVGYAQEKYGLHAEFRWKNQPYNALISDPLSGSWLAFLMYHHIDDYTGEILEACDIRCGRLECEKLKGFYGFTQPFQMRGSDWLGVTMSDSIDAALVREAFDEAVRFSGKSGRKEIVISYDNPYESTVIPQTVTFTPVQQAKIPSMIVRMMQMYQPGRETSADKAGNFYRQGMFMKDYTDDAPWNGDISRAFPVYHDLRVDQLRGYFTWRTHFRKGEYAPVNKAFLKIYIYELLNQIGVKDADESLACMEHLEETYDVKGMLANMYLEIDLNEWKCALCVYNNLPQETARKYVPRERIEVDQACTVLDHPDQHSDEEVYGALMRLGGYNISSSQIVKKDARNGRQLFAFVWKSLMRKCMQNNYPLFQRCIGWKDELTWIPFTNAVFYEQDPHPDGIYVLDEGRSFVCHGGRWKEQSYHLSTGSLKNLKAVMRETDRQARQRLMKDHQLSQKPVERILQMLIQDALNEFFKQKEEESRPHVSIDLSKLSTIRSDAALTRDRLLTEEEKEEDVPETEQVQPAEEAHESILSDDEREVVRLALKGESCRAYLRAHHLMASVVCDGINDKLMEQIGDTAVESDGSDITIVEDYREDLEVLIGGDI